MIKQRYPPRHSIPQKSQVNSQCDTSVPINYDPSILGQKNLKRAARAIEFETPRPRDFAKKARARISQIFCDRARVQPSSCTGSENPDVVTRKAIEYRVAISKSAFKNIARPSNWRTPHQGSITRKEVSLKFAQRNPRGERGVYVTTYTIARNVRGYTWPVLWTKQIRGRNGTV